MSLVVHYGTGTPEILFIQRAAAKADPWSGQIAFPGGGEEAQDIDLVDTAIRETEEEVRLTLPAGGLFGQLDDQQGRNNNREISLIISCFIFALDHKPALTPNYEVAEAFWIPLELLEDQSRAFQYQTRYRQEPYPAIHLGQGAAGQDLILWGLTHRFVRQFLSII